MGFVRTLGLVLLVLPLALSVVAIHAAEAAPDAVSREVFIVMRTSHVDAVSREVVIRRVETIVDATSREVVIFRSQSQRDVVSREVSLSLLGDVTVPDGFLAREYARIPDGSAEWMSLAVQPSPTKGHLDLYVAATTKQFGALGDPPDDHLFKVDRNSLDVVPVLSFEASETDPIDLAFGGGGSFGSELYVLARHLDGYLPGDGGGQVLVVDESGDPLPFFSDLQVTTAPTGLVVLPTARAGFAEAIYCANDSSLPHGAFAFDAGGAETGFAVEHASGFASAAFAPGNDFGDALYLGGDDGAVYVADAVGGVVPFSVAMGPPIQSMAFSNGHGFGQYLYAVLGDGRVVRFDAAAQPETFLLGLLIQPIFDDVVRNDLTFTPFGDQLYVSDALRGAVYGVRVELPTAADEPGPTPALRTALLGNFPNPFNPSTMIRFELARRGRAELTVYDARGRQVRRLTGDGVYEPGIHEVRWNGRDDQGRSVSSGVYFAMLRAAEAATGHKMLLLK